MINYPSKMEEAPPWANFGGAYPRIVLDFFDLLKVLTSLYKKIS
jgi:hypothetical protein